MGTEPSQLDNDIDTIFQLGDAADNNADITKQADDAQDTPNAEGADTTQGADTAEGAEQQDKIEPPLDARPQRDANGNILDKDGRILATGKREQDLFFQLNRTRAAATKLNETNARLEGEVRALRQYAELPKRLGLEMAQAEEALRFRAQIAADPVRAVQEIVARVLANGYTMQQLFGDDAPSTINASIINRTLDDRLRPITERFAAEEREQRLNDAAQRDMEEFLDQHEHADVHGELIARIVSEKGLSPSQAYYELKIGATQRGLDFSKPLIEQMRGKQQKSSAPAQTRTTPGGNRTVAANTAQSMSDREQMISPSTSFKDIVAMAMKSAS